MKRTLTSLVGLVVVLTLVTAFFAGPSQVWAHSSEPSSSSASPDFLATNRLSQHTPAVGLSLLPAYFGAYGLDPSGVGELGVGLDAAATVQSATAANSRSNSMALPVYIDGWNLQAQTVDAIESWARNAPDIASAAPYTPTLRTVGPGAGTVVFTDTLDEPFTVTLVFASWLTREITLSYAPAESGTVASYAVGYHRFDLGVSVDGEAAPGFELAGYMAMTVQYDNSDVVGLDEDALTLDFWDATLGAWVDAASICEPPRNYLRNPGYNQFTVSLCQFSQYPGAMAGFYGAPTSGQAPLTVVFTNTSVGGVSQYLWTFGDGATSSAENPSHIYTVPGVYTVTLTASDGATVSNTLTRTSYISVYTAPTASFVGVPTSGTVPLLVDFTNNSSNYTGSAWDFGDGGTSTDTNPSHTYNATGWYTVTLTVTGPGGSDTLVRPIYIQVNAVWQPVVANFYGAPTSGDAPPLTVVFTNTSTGELTGTLTFPLSSLWDFGDGSTSTDRNPTHTYTASGVYTVTLHVSNILGSDTLTRVSYITVNYVPVAADFTGTPTSGLAPLGVNFSNTSTGDFTASSWTFGDGGSSTATNPFHSYTTPGVYTVSLQVSGPGGSDTETKISYIQVFTAPVADFLGTPTSGTPPLAVTFTNNSSNYTSSSWDFGDGSTSTATNPSHTYNAIGWYTVTLTVTGPGGSDTLVRPAYIQVNAVPQPVVANFYGAPTSGSAPLTVVFTNTSTGELSGTLTFPLNSWWDFGDGSTSTDTNPTHTYTMPGVYTVSLYVSNILGSDTLTRTSYIIVIAAGGSIDIDPLLGGSGVFTNASGSTVSVLVRDHSVTETMTLVYTQLATTTTTPDGFMFGNIVFTLEAFVGGIHVPGYSFLRPIAITVNYTDDEVAGLDENTLRLYYWDETSSSWVDVINTCSPPGNYLRYPGYNQLTVSICHLSEIGLFGRSTGAGIDFYLPILLKE